jgi:hypothetical protein
MDPYTPALTTSLVRGTNKVQSNKVKDCISTEPFNCRVSAQRFIRDVAKPQHFASLLVLHPLLLSPFYCGQAVVSTTQSSRKYSEKVLLAWCTNSMEHRPYWEADSGAAGKQSPCVFRNTKTHYRVIRSHHLVPTLSQMNVVNTSIPISLRITLIVSCHLRLGLPSDLFF